MTARRHSKPASAAPLERLSEELLDSYLGDERARRISRRYLPSREAIAEILAGRARSDVPGLFRPPRSERARISRRTWRKRSAALAPKIEREMEHCLCYGREREAARLGVRRVRAARARIDARSFWAGCRRFARCSCATCRRPSTAIPAATNLDEVILAYPGVLAVSVYRIAHALYDLGVPMMARIMTEWAHSKTGCDIHPGAKIGAAFFIDHATGVVIGETTEIGEGVKLYQGVTLGALSLSEGCERPDHPRPQAPSDGRERRDPVRKRHRARRSNRRRRGQRHRRLGVPDAQRAAALARVAQGAGTARRLARRRGRARRDLLRHLAAAALRRRAFTSSCRAAAPAAAPRC